MSRRDSSFSLRLTTMWSVKSHFSTPSNNSRLLLLMVVPFLAAWCLHCNGPSQSGDRPELAVAPDSLDFGETNTSLFLTIDNKGSGVLNWSIQAPSEEWISVDQDSGTVIDAPLAVEVRIDRNTAPAGRQRVALEVTGGAEKKEVILIASVSRPGTGEPPDSLIVGQNTAPIADAGLDQTVGVGGWVRLDGRESGDADGDILTYQWIAPVEIELEDAAAAQAHFRASATGTYRIRLVVDDGQVNSDPDEVVVTVIENISSAEISGEIEAEDTPASILARAEVVVSASDMEKIRQDLTISENVATATVRDIPAGKARQFTLNGYDAAGDLVFRGFSQVDLPPGEVVSVRTTMARVESSSGPQREITIELRGENFYLRGVAIDMVWIEPGTFTMGSPSWEEGHESDEGPQHEVTISQGFYLGKYEITQEQWEAVMGTRPWAGQERVQEDPHHPAVYISWKDVEGFTDRLNEWEGEEVYRFPTEAEWEYACRAGTTTRWSFGNDESPLGNYAWYRGNAWDSGEQYAHQVGTKLPNPWGLYDMHGNVWEWVQDWFSSYTADDRVDPVSPAVGTYRVVRSGGFFGYARGMRSTDRLRFSPGARNADLGARLLRMR